MVKSHKQFLKLLISGILLIYLGVRIDWRILLKTLSGIKLEFYIFSTVIAMGCPILLAWKYYCILRKTSLELSIKRLLVINFISRFYALFLPTAIGPDIIRWYQVTKNRQGRSFFLASTIVERLIFILMLLLFGTVPLFFINNPAIVALSKKIFPLLATAYIASCMALTYFIFPGANRVINTIIKTIISITKDSKLDLILNSFSLKSFSHKRIGALFVLSFFWQIFFLLRTYMLFISIGLSISFLDVTMIVSLVLLVQILPVSFAGIGIREGAYAYFIGLYGAEPEKGVLIGILFFSQMIFFATIGAILNVFEK